MLEMGSIAVIVLFFTYFWANVGYVLFAKVNPLDFGTLPDCNLKLISSICMVHCDYTNRMDR